LDNQRNKKILTKSLKPVRSFSCY